MGDSTARENYSKLQAFVETYGCFSSPMKLLILFLTACSLPVCNGCGSTPDPNTERAITVARKWVVDEGYSLDGLTFRASSNPDTGEWIVLMESSPAPAGGHTTLILDKDFVVQSAVLGR